ncbi:MAG: hypothetical protein JSS02_03820 [Planctomycetes bacterium]|nr:hypothetical protein [Planctomycetota bacterium]
MLNTFKHAMLTCVAVASALLVSDSSASAGIVVDSYLQQVATEGHDPQDSSNDYAFSPGPLSTSSNAGYAKITSSEATATSIAFSYSLGLSGNFDTQGFANTSQDVFFHVTEDTSFAYNLSAYDLASYGSDNYAYLFDFTVNDYVFQTPFPGNAQGAGFTFSGTLIAGHDYDLYTFVQPKVNSEFGSTEFAMTGHSALTVAPELTVVPEPSAFALSSLLLGGFGVIALIKRGKRNAAAV